MSNKKIKWYPELKIEKIIFGNYEHMTNHMRETVSESQG